MPHAEMIPHEDALRIVDETLSGALLPAERLPTREAEGRVLRSDHVSQIDQPPFDRSAMDGYAIRDDDDREAYRVLETIAAGTTGTCKLEPGTAIKIMTGAPVPEGAGRVVIIEEAEEKDGLVRFRRKGGSTNIAWKGEDIRSGDVLMKAGTPLGALQIANLISCGVTEVEVSRCPRFAVLSTGDEIVDDPKELRPGRIMNSNGPLMTNLARRHGLQPVLETIVPDNLEATVRTLKEALERADIVAFSGGVSEGDFDYVLGALPQAGLDVKFTRVAVKPGKPTVFATGNDRVVFGLPGNPVSVLLAFHFFVRRAAAHMTGSQDRLRTLRLPLAKYFKRRKGKRKEYLPARLATEGQVEAIVGYNGSGHLSALLQADGVFAVPLDVTEMAAGTPVDFTALRTP